MPRVDKLIAMINAVDTIKREEFTDYFKAARHFKYDLTSVSKRIRLLTRTRRDADSLFRQCLTNDQERVLIDSINYLSERKMPLTIRIVRNLAEEIRVYSAVGCAMGTHGSGCRILDQPMGTLIKMGPHFSVGERIEVEKLRAEKPESGNL